MKIKCLLADDNPEALIYLTALCSKHSDLNIVGKFMDGLEFFEAQQDIDYEACFLDIDMPGMNGMELAQLLQGKKIIFVSAHKDRAWEAFGVKAVDFVPKPIQASRFEAAIIKLREAVRLDGPITEHQNIIFPTSSGKSQINSTTIVLIRNGESEENIPPRDKIAVLNSGKKLHLKNLALPELLESHLPQGKFLQISRSVLFNVDHPFTKQNHDTLIIDLPDHPRPIELTIGRSYATKFKERFPNA
jgi:DNA-binding LytR/AlgR family response regulator